MVDHSKNPDEEYQFPQEEAYSTEKPAPASAEAPVMGGHGAAPQWMERFSNLSTGRKRVLFVVLVVILLIIFFKVFEHKETVITPVQQSVSAQTPSTNDNSQMLGSLDALQSHSTRTESELSTLKSRVSDLQDTLNETQSQNQKLQAQVSSLNAQVKDLSSQVEEILQKLSPKKAPTIVFHLRAVVPDRAWILSGSGDEQSVTVGDKIQDYGTVKSIDAKNGVVLTSSGRKIIYGPNDY